MSKMATGKRCFAHATHRSKEVQDTSCRGFGGVLGACDAPLRRFAVMVQRDAAGVWGVVPRSRLSSPMNGGLRGLKRSLCNSLYGGSFSGFPRPRIREDRPRFHEDMLGGNDPPEADRESEGVP